MANGSAEQLHPLQNTWCIWEHKVAKSSADWGDSMQSLAEFATVEDFWKVYNNVPKPSQVMFDGSMRKKVGDRVIDSYSIFKKGIKPEWEAPENNQGGEWQSRSKLTPQALDLFWENMVLGLVGETVDVGDEICGARVVDKSKNNHNVYRFELWLRSNDSNTAARLRERLKACLADRNLHEKLMPSFDWKSHGGR
ncbi:unnamed protein product [Ectocarpus fasciculatus]